VTSLLFGEELSHVFLGALLAVCRADGDVNTDELNALREVAQKLSVAQVNESLLFTHVHPRTFADVVRRGAGERSPFRSADACDPRRIAELFLDHALGIARIDGPLNAAEARTIRGFARELGSPHQALEKLDAMLDDSFA